MARVSIIIPAFNAEATIAETLASVLAQTYDDWEVFIGDDGSTDATAEVACGFGRRINVVRGSTKGGPASARNAAIAQSSGELLAFLDADDLWLPGYLDEQVRCFDTHNAPRGNIGIVACNARRLGPEGFLPGTYMDHIDVSGEVTLTHLLRGNPIFVSVVSPRHVVEEAGGFCADLFGTEDRDLWIRILELGYRVVRTSTVLAVYRVRGASVSSDERSMARANQLVYRRALERGRLTEHQARIARRELRLQVAVEHIASPARFPSRRVFAALPLLARVALEHPDRWSSFARNLIARRRRLARLPR